jgi:preprotein translocase subunit SecA
MSGALDRKRSGSSSEGRNGSDRPRVAAINAREPELEKRSDEDLRARTAAFKQRVAERASPDHEATGEAIANAQGNNGRGGGWMDTDGSVMDHCNCCSETR